MDTFKRWSFLQKRFVGSMELDRAANIPSFLA